MARASLQHEPGAEASCSIARHSPPHRATWRAYCPSGPQKGEVQLCDSRVNQETADAARKLTKRQMRWGTRRVVRRGKLSRRAQYTRVIDRIAGSTLGGRLSGGKQEEQRHQEIGTRTATPLELRNLHTPYR